MLHYISISECSEPGAGLTTDPVSGLKPYMPFGDTWKGVPVLTAPDTCRRLCENQKQRVKEKANKTVDRIKLLNDNMQE